MSQVAYQRTIVSPGQALGAIQAALPGDAPMQAVVMIGAQSAIETAGWKAMGNFNMGNVTTGNPSRDAWMYQGSNPLKFKAFPDLQSGAADMVHWLSTRGVLPFAYAGNLQGYVAQLAARCYVGCVSESNNPYPDYQSGMSGWISRLSTVVPIPPSFSLSSAERGLIAAAAVVGLSYAALHFKII